MRRVLLILSLFLLATPGLVLGQEEAPPGDTTQVVDSTLFPAPVTNLQAADAADDHGHAITLTWDISADDGRGKSNVLGYEVFRWEPDEFGSVPARRDTVAFLQYKLSSDWSQPIPDSPQDSMNTHFAGQSPEQLAAYSQELSQKVTVAMSRLKESHETYPENGDWEFVATVPSGTGTFKETGNKERESNNFLPDYCDFYYRVDAITADASVRTGARITEPVQSFGQLFNRGRLPVFIYVILFGVMTVYFVSRARKGQELYVRPLAGIEAVDDAIGRATEMGRPILYVLGLGTAADVATIASFTILGRVAKRVAEYQTELIVPTYDPIVMSVAQEVVKSAYLDAGRADSYKEDTVHFVTQSQFAYVAAVNGTMLRELPATNVYMGKFFAESLLLAETGALAGSIQISGTDEIAQIPFFIVACDYTLIGEELYAASAYLGREPVLLGSLKAQDYAKAAVLILAIAGLVAANLDMDGFVQLFYIAN